MISYLIGWLDYTTALLFTVIITSLFVYVTLVLRNRSPVARAGAISSAPRGWHLQRPNGLTMNAGIIVLTKDNPPVLITTQIAGERGPNGGHRNAEMYTASARDEAIKALALARRSHYDYAPSRRDIAVKHAKIIDEIIGRCNSRATRNSFDLVAVAGNMNVDAAANVLCEKLPRRIVVMRFKLNE